ncbi:MAG: right-handed parallel beta-helix repeat-containing protein [Phaeodactylibacter sp.]|nr:right-handed parallel beta-helix repeat-containing protein [Phaeodactylibacter sp.]
MKTQLTPAVLLAHAFFFLSNPILGTTIRVPADSSTIQAAINGSVDGDTVLVAPGTYTEGDIELLGKEVVVVSEAGAALTTIDAEGENLYGFYAHQGEGQGTVIKGFRIVNASSAGISLDSGSPKVQDCIIENNTRGLFLQSTDGIIEGCIIRNNSSGGGIHSRSGTADAIVRNCLLARNYSNLEGGGIYITNSQSPTFINCTIVSNEARTRGGGVFAFNGWPIRMRNCILWGNVAPEDPGITAESSDITYSNIQDGWTGTGNINTNPVFVNRYTEDYHLHSISPCIDKGDPEDDFSHEPQPNGGRINMGAYGNTSEAASFVLETVIIQYFAEPTCGPETTVTIEGLYLGTDGMAMAGGQIIPANDILQWTDTLIQFTAPTDWIGSGSPIVVSTSLGTDSIPGEFQYPPTVQYVSGEVSGVWTKDCPGIYVLTSDIVIPEGQSLVIEPGVQVLVNTDSIYSASFQVLGTLIAEGAATDSILFSTLPYQRRPGAWDGIVLESGNSNSNVQMKYCIVEFAETGITAEHDNIVIENSIIRNNENYGVAWVGVVSDASGIIRQCTIKENQGWGVLCEAVCYDNNGYASPTIEGNYIENNDQGGINIRAIGGNPSSWNGFFPEDYAYAEPVILNNVIRYNDGLAISSYANGDITEGNFTIHKSWAYANPRIENNVIFNNAASFKAEAPWGTFFTPWLSHTSPLLINNTFYNNGLTAITSGDSATVAIANSIFWGDGTPGIEYYGGGQTFITNSNFPELQEGAGNISAAPLFFEPANNDFRLLASSPCIDAGDNEAANENTDITGAPRISDGNGDGNSSVDMGAYEYHLPQVIMQPVASPEACEGEDVLLSTSAEGDGLGYQWQKGGQDIPGATAEQLTLSNVQTGDSGAYTCVVTDELGGSVQTEAAELTVHPLSNVSVQIEASATSTCQGEEVIFTAIPINGGASPVFQWLLDGEPAGENSPTLYLAPEQGDHEVECTLLSSAGCTLNNPAMSNTLAFTVNPLPEVTLSLPDTIDGSTGLVELTGGFPTGGVYSGPGVSQSGSIFFFDPATAGGGTQAISYNYTDENGCSATATAELLVGLKNHEASLQSVVFPNPSSGRFYLRADQPIKGWVITVFSLQGSKLWEGTWRTGGEKVLNLHGYPKGTYLLQVADGKRAYTRKLIIQ